jgi:purine-binding chemotaxis protein CheW
MAGGKEVAEKTPAQRMLVCEVGRRACGLSLVHVAETMRPLPLEPLALAPAFVAGLSIVRGEPIPVLDLRLLLGSTVAPESARRLVTLHIDARRAGLLVDAVQGVRSVPAETLQTLPRLLGDASAEVVTEIGRLDERLLLVLEAGRMVPASVWAAMGHGERPA